MWKKASWTFGAALFAGGAWISIAAGADDFSDVPDSHWAVGEIGYLQSENVVQGHGDGTFGPDENMTRAHLAVMITRAEDLDTTDRPDPGFDDVSEDHYAFAEIAAVADEGIISGSGDSFLVDDTLNRGEMAAILDRTYDFTTSDSVEFSDVPDDHMFNSEINHVAAQGLARGYEDGTFRPEEGTTRAELSTFLARSMAPHEFIENWADQGAVDTAEEIVSYLSEEDMESVADYVHPEAGVRFSPYAFVDPDEHESFNRVEAAELSDDDTVYDWGTYDGKGGPIDKTYSEYHDRFVYAEDYENEGSVAVDRRQSNGSMIDNTDEVYPSATVVEYHVPDEGEGLEWRSLRLAMAQYDGDWHVIGIINDEWTT
ncbi:S-layer family protein [Salsuginibacillus halophilus]|uniref:S-layer family protein n=1 Tax=Salsuginibacillus halophilus TaxID=517424 RepID=A0A2P8HQK7_9BACI|nr:S-layer homology domain-containing protein [Salsuginibacillus halophilus]PSL48510.1 S-layer family protein [Salsuginibacillus halophilus]